MPYSGESRSVGCKPYNYIMLNNEGFFILNTNKPEQKCILQINISYLLKCKNSL